jgi:hypothetical protein
VSRAVWSRVLGLVFGGAFAIGVGCGGKSEQRGSGTGGSGAGASAGTAGSTGGTGSSGKGGSNAGSGGTMAGAAGTIAPVGGARNGGASGRGGTSGVAGEGGTSTAGAGNGGAAGIAAAGMGGMASAVYPECETADDCTLQSDCCGCQSVPADGREACALDCDASDPCLQMGITSVDVQCANGRCVFGRSCDGQASCFAAPPECPEGEVPSVNGGCWGPCLPPTECLTVASCDDCGDAFCVEFQARGSHFGCVTRVETCDRENYCECLGVCGECSKEDDAVVCPCLVC